MLIRLATSSVSYFILLTVVVGNLCAADYKDKEVQLYNKIFQTPFTLIPDIDTWPTTCLASELQIQEKYLNEWLPFFKSSLDEVIKSKLVDEILKTVSSGKYDSLTKVEHFSNMEVTNLLKEESNFRWIKNYFFRRLNDLSMRNTCKDRCLGSFVYNIAHCEYILKGSSRYLSALSHELAEYAISSLANSETKKLLEHITWVE